MNRIFLDFETRSAVDIKKVGAWAYAQHPSTEIMCLAISRPNEKPRLMKGEPGPIRTADLDVRRKATFLASADAILVAHNAAFEYAIYNFILHERYGWPAIWDPKRWDCTLARSVACGLPASLEYAGKALDLHLKKDLDGRAALMKLCKPKGYDPLGDPIYEEDPRLYEKLYAYCIRDVEAEMELDAKLPVLSADERKVWELDLEINRRGVQVDVELAKKAAAMAEELKGGLNAQLASLTSGAVDSASRVAAIKRYLQANGVEIPTKLSPADGEEKETLDKHAVDGLLDDPAIPEKVKAVLRIRRQVGKSSNAKYNATVNASCSDGRVRGVLQYHAAATGRWGGRLIQPQNYPKGLAQKEQARAIELIRTGDAELFSLYYGDAAMETLSGTLRGTIIPTPGKKLIVADYSAIEARVVLWLAGDEEALEKYRKGVNLYVDMAKFIYRNAEVGKHSHPKEYAVGKAAILGCGYGMGAERFQGTCEQNGVEIPLEMAVRAVKAYREKYSKVVQTWYAVEKAAANAIRSPGSVQKCCGGRVAFGLDRRREFLCCRLPSGRLLRYYHPSLKMQETPRGPKEEIKYFAAGINGELEEQKTYGGSLVENITQAVARDIMAAGMQKVEAAGYEVVLTVHDEIVAEKGPVGANGRLPDAGHYAGEDVALKNFLYWMCDVPAWAKGCPIAAEGWIGGRYRK